MSKATLDNDHTDWATTLMSRGKWSDDTFLNGLTQCGDALADATVAKLDAQGELASVSRIFQIMRANDEPLPADAPVGFQEFFAQTGALGPDVDMARLRRGEAVYLRHALTAALVLLAKSLPEGYSAPNLTQILSLSGDLAHHPYRRLLGVLQLVVNISSVRGFEDTGSAVVSAQKMRLLHAGVRHIARKRLPDFSAQYGVPVNLEDMLATLMGFSYLVIEGLRTLRVGLADDEAEDLYYVWRIFARLVGIYPEGQPNSFEYIPANVAEAAEFYRSYARRHYVDAPDNPQGVVLAQHNLGMIEDLLSRHGHLPGIGTLARVYMIELMGAPGAARVGISPETHHTGLEALVGKILPPVVQGVMDVLPGHSAERLSRLVFQGLIEHSYGKKVEFLVPDSVADLRELA